MGTTAPYLSVCSLITEHMQTKEYYSDESPKAQDNGFFLKTHGLSPEIL